MNYPYYNPYMPPAAGASGFQPPRPDQMVQGFPQAAQAIQGAPQSQMQAFQVRPVTGREEAVAAQVDFFGAGTLMPDLAHGKIYFKRFNSNTGASDIFSFSVDRPEPEDSAQLPQYATQKDLEEMREVIQGLARDVEQLRRPMRGGKRLDPDE